MPFYCFACTDCGQQQKLLMSKAKADAFNECPSCGSSNIKQRLGRPEGRSVETADEYRNTKLVSGVSQMVDERAQDHFRTHDLPRIIAEQGLEFAQRQGFVDQDGRPKK